MRPDQKSEDVSLRFARVLERIRAGADMIDLDDVCAWEEDERVRRLGLPKVVRCGCTRIEVVYCFPAADEQVAAPKGGRGPCVRALAARGPVGVSRARPEPA